MLRLVGANLNYSSWTIRAWLALKMAGAEFKLHDVGLMSKPDWKEQILTFSGAGLVPVLIDGALSIHETLAIGEYLHELQPEADLWPRDRALRARGRAICCEVSSGFRYLSKALPVNWRARTTKPIEDERVAGDITRVGEIWEASLAGTGGPYLLGAQPTLADCFYAPVAARFRTYGVTLSGRAAEYASSVLSLPEVHELETIASEAPPIAYFDSLLESEA